jgi:hypothetical protein
MHDYGGGPQRQRMEDDSALSGDIIVTQTYLMVVLQCEPPRTPGDNSRTSHSHPLPHPHFGDEESRGGGRRRRERRDEEDTYSRARKIATGEARVTSYFLRVHRSAERNAEKRPANKGGGGFNLFLYWIQPERTPNPHSRKGTLLP